MDGLGKSLLHEEDFSALTFGSSRVLDVQHVSVSYFRTLQRARSFVDRKPLTKSGGWCTLLGFGFGFRTLCRDTCPKRWKSGFGMVENQLQKKKGNDMEAFGLYKDLNG